MNDDIDYMCPNCITPWKCNGPHLPEKRFDWSPEPHPWCDACCVPANACGCPTGERLAIEALEAHLIRGEE